MSWVEYVHLEGRMGLNCWSIVGISETNETLSPLKRISKPQAPIILRIIQFPMAASQKKKFIFYASLPWFRWIGVSTANAKYTRRVWGVWAICGFGPCLQRPFCNWDVKWRRKGHYDIHCPNQSLPYKRHECSWGSLRHLVVSGHSHEDTIWESKTPNIPSKRNLHEFSWSIVRKGKLGKKIRMNSTVSIGPRRMEMEIQVTHEFLQGTFWLEPKSWDTLN